MSELKRLPAGFAEHVTRWLVDERPGAVELLGIEEYGTNWAGDTEGGFYPEFEMTVVYRDEAGERQEWDVAGEDLASLWQWVVSGWPAL